MKGLYSIMDPVGLMDCTASVNFPILLGCVCMTAEVVVGGVLCHGVNVAPWQETIGTRLDLTLAV